ncbi:YjfB family protein [Clostridium beijerinckii]|uniref:Motility protein n=1 Tax=Clostridium beijerinckii TaxID=1520 RepID=A0A1S8S8Q3_CLOBE|nr:YjfB family protein [Clostridium beijerinckii]NRY60031.1 uncharacterized 2Fe-2S/4Fe-4S cluster protein (DUF4445 family) [Clostridium beijerinckii]OOM61784.1 hypothetical protein CLBCK_21500 [Clostridium beijerinckii]
MDIGGMSIIMHQVSLQSAVSISVAKMAMNNEINTANEMTNMMNNVAVDTSRGTAIDVRV